MTVAPRLVQHAAEKIGVGAPWSWVMTLAVLAWVNWAATATWSCLASVVMRRGGQEVRRGGNLLWSGGLCDVAFH